MTFEKVSQQDFSLVTFVVSITYVLKTSNSFNPLNSDGPSCARKQNPSEIPMRPHAPCQKWLVLIGCSLET